MRLKWLNLNFIKTIKKLNHDLKNILILLLYVNKLIDVFVSCLFVTFRDNNIYYHGENNDKCTVLYSFYIHTVRTIIMNLYV